MQSASLNLRQFTSDNRGGIMPEVWAALAEANVGHAASYGDDPWTLRAADLIRDLFAIECDVYFVATGTAANSLALASLCQSYHAVICHEYAHIETDECGAPEFFSNGTKLLLAKGSGGKIVPSDIDGLVSRRSDVHYPRPRVVSLTQATELGTVYSPDEIGALCGVAKSRHLRVHMDGARFANAVAAIGCDPADLTWRAGVDVLCLGGTKNGLLGGEAIIFFDRSLSHEFVSRCKQSGHLLSKMRFLGAQWVGLLQDGAWLRYAAHTNRMARLLQAALKETAGIDPMFPVQANSVFAELPPTVLAGLRDRHWDLYNFIGVGGTRFMCAWDTQPSDIERLQHDLSDILATSIETSSRNIPAIL